MLTRTEIKRLKVDELRGILAEKGLDTTGIKNVLVERVLDSQPHDPLDEYTCEQLRSALLSVNLNTKGSKKVLKARVQESNAAKAFLYNNQHVEDTTHTNEDDDSNDLLLGDATTFAAINLDGTNRSSAISDSNSKVSGEKLAGYTMGTLKDLGYPDFVALSEATRQDTVHLLCELSGNRYECFDFRKRQLGLLWNGTRYELMERGGRTEIIESVTGHYCAAKIVEKQRFGENRSILNVALHLPHKGGKKDAYKAVRDLLNSHHVDDVHAVVLQGDWNASPSTITNVILESSSYSFCVPAGAPTTENKTTIDNVAVSNDGYLCVNKWDPCIVREMTAFTHRPVIGNTYSSIL